MPLVSIAKELQRARVGRYALALFDTVDMHATEGMLAAFEGCEIPGMVAMYAGLLDRDNARAFAKYIRARRGRKRPHQSHARPRSHARRLPQGHRPRFHRHHV
ncbi:MAG TPA: hypothetical protein QGH10_23785 [Armatimonadota bacterium]|nr:hypothetical protein [Armatimonadota bacterium]